MVDKDTVLERFDNINLGEEGIFNIILDRPLYLKEGDNTAFEKHMPIVEIITEGEGLEAKEVPVTIEMCIYISRQGGKWKKHWRYGTLIKKEV